MNLLAVSGSVRGASTNTALLRALARHAPENVAVDVYDGVDRLPVFDPDVDRERLPPAVTDFVARLATADGLVIASPEYVRAIPGGLKNAIDWLVAGEEMIDKPVALAHASHRGDDMLASLRTVLATVTTRFAQDVFLRVALGTRSPAEVAGFLAGEEQAQAIRDYLYGFARFVANGTTSRAPFGSGEAIEIVRAAPDDWTRVRALRLRALLDAPDAFSSRYATSASVTEREWRERLAGPRAATFVARVDGREVGLAVGAPYEGTDAAGLFSMWTAPEARRRGAAVALIETVVDWARAAGYRRMLLDVADANGAAVALYARAGFVPDGVTGTLPPPRERLTEHRRERRL